MPKKRLRLALIGCGDNMIRSHVPRLQVDGAVDVAAVADPVRVAADRVMAEWGAEVPYYPDWRRMLRDCDVDGVVISTPHDAHYAQVRAALAAGRHVLVEKPLTISARRAKGLLDQSDAAGRLLVVSYQRHHMAPYAYARELVRKGRLGRVRGIVGYITQGWFDVGGWRMQPAVSGGGMFMDTGSHLVASALWVSGLRPKRVTATLSYGEEPVDVTATVQLAFDQGAVGTLTTIGDAGRHDERLAISGSMGSLVLHNHQWLFRSMLLDDEPVAVPARVRDTTPDQAFLAWIRNGGRGYERADFAYDTARLTEAVYRSASRNAPAPIRS